MVKLNFDACIAESCPIGLAFAGGDEGGCFFM